MSDPGFPRGEAPIVGGGVDNLLFGIIFAENYIEMKKLGGGAHPPLVNIWWYNHCDVKFLSLPSNEV